MRGRRARGRPPGRGGRTTAGVRRAACAAAVVLGLVLGGAGPVAGPLGVGAAAAQGPTSGVAPPTPAEARHAVELRRVARDALAEDGSGIDLDGGLRGIGGVVWPVVLVVVLLLLGAVVVALARRGPRARRRAAADAAAPDDVAAELEERARRAEQAGEHRAAVVLWFRAGTRRLRERRRVRADAAATAAQVARESGDPRVGVLATAHDRAAYGPGPVAADASRGAREGWAEVLGDAAGRGTDGPRSSVPPSSRTGLRRPGGRSATGPTGPGSTPGASS